MQIVLGPPGTGKTTKLNLVEQYMQSGVPPDRIGLLCLYTRRAATEAIDRACD